MIAPLRALLFNLVYYGSTLIIGIVIVPLLLLPERIYWPLIRLYFFYVYILERTILGLNYRLSGQENLPAGPYIVAAKHQSAYETLKLPVIFPHPVVILKRELLRIPFWGWYAWKSGMIGINRRNARQAIDQMIAGAKDAAAKNRTLVIFPQGTRVGVSEDTRTKPYRRGIAEIYAATGLPVVPLALNSGYFWPRNAVMKRGGTVDMVFLPPIPPGLDKETFLARLEHSIETAAAALPKG